VACDLIWFYENKSFHEGTTQDTLAISKTINKVSLEHYNAWKLKLSPSVEHWTQFLHFSSRSILI